MPEVEEPMNFTNEEILAMSNWRFEDFARKVRERIRRDPVADEDDLRALDCIKKRERKQEEELDAWLAHFRTPEFLASCEKSEERSRARQAYMDKHGIQEGPNNLLQDLSPKVWSAWHGFGNFLMVWAIIICWGALIYGIATQEFGIATLFMVVTLLVMIRYAPIFTVVSMMPYWFLYAAVDGIIYGTETSYRRILAWFLVWSLYPLLKGLWHIYRWEEERNLGLPLHPVSNHPYATAAACIGTAVAVRHFSKK
jgi:hypothetical protein